MKVLICGAGKSGVAAARLARADGDDVTVADEGSERPETAAQLDAAGCRAVWGAASAPEGEWELAVTSPGLDARGAFLMGLEARGVRVESEIEFGWRHWRGRTLSVTGSNGKTSVVKALTEALETTGRRAKACGNYGIPVCEAVAGGGGAEEWLVMELSSFQLETVRDFRPEVALTVNILPNHLDRHGDMETYAGLKARMYARQCEKDVAVAPAGWAGFLRAKSKGQGHWTTFGPGGTWGWQAGRVSGEGMEVEMGGSYFDNEVLGENAAGLVAAGLAAGISAESLGKTLRNFRPLGHRGAVVWEENGVRWVDDSKATNLAALTAAVRMQGGRRVRLIAGGRPKEQDWSGALEVLKARAEKVYLIGEAAGMMEAAWGRDVPCRRCGDLPHAVATARADAKAGESVVLAPGCTSYDQFRSYGERGDVFARLVREKSP